LDAATGTVKWIFKPTVAPGTQLELTSPATSVGNSIYVGAGVLDQRPGGWHGYVYCLDAQTGTEKSRLEMEGQCTSAPVLSEGVIFVSLGGFICALDVATGIQKWRSEVALSQTVIVSAVTVFTMSPRDVLALDAETGAVKWRFSGTDQINSLWGTPNLAMENGVVYAVGYPKYLYALDANTGQVRWQAAPAE
jgi:outer membrane protein assembly factor BamB